MIIANLPESELKRQEILRSLRVLDTPRENIFDDITKLAAKICGTPISLISLVDSNRQWFKSVHGLDFSETLRELSFCSHTILEEDFFEVPDATRDPRFATNPFVTGEPNIAYYAGIPLRCRQGYNIGSLCVIDHRPRKLSLDQIEMLQSLARQVIHLFEAYSHLREQESAEALANRERDDSIRMLNLLREERLRMLSYLDRAPVGISVIAGPDFVFEVVNQEYQGFVGAERVLEGNKFFDLFPKYRGSEIETMLQQVYYEQKSISATDYLAIKENEDGTIEHQYFDFQMQPFLSPAGKKGILTIVLDTTKKNLALQQTIAAKLAADQANKAKSFFLANMSHEIRTPLGAIMGFAEELAQPDIKPEQHQRYLDVINRNSAHLQRIIDDILDLSKVEAGKVLIEAIPCSISELVAEFAALMSHRALENKVKFTCTIQMGVPDWVLADPGRLKQILTNAVGNAFKFSPNGRVDLIVSAAGDFLEFKVKDTGIGLTNEQAEKIFHPFTQADSSTARKFGGTGLGLVLTKKLCEAMGGTFYLESSRPLIGSTFVARVKVQTAQLTTDSEIHARPVSRRRINKQRPLEAIKILLVEDSEDNQLLIRILLEKAGALVESAYDGEEGVRKAMSNAFDIVLMDVQMPQLDGLEATQRLRSRGYKKPVIALTAHAMHEEKQRCLQAGFDDFLTKPIRREQILSSLETYI